MLIHAYVYASQRKQIEMGPWNLKDGGGKKVNLRYEFEKTGQEKYGAGGIGKLYFGDEKVGEGQIPRTIGFRYSFDESFDIGRDSASPVTDEYKAGSRFTGGNIEKVVIDLTGERHVDHEQESQ
jgi:hypothetical protein